jgi:formate hydrogenlyase transcriptional activator
MEESAQRIFQVDPERRLEFEMLISDISACFIRLNHHEVDQQIEANMRRIREFLQLDRTTLWQLSGNEPDEFVLTHMDAKPGLPPVVAPQIGTKNLPWMSERISRGEELRFPSLNSLPEEAAKDIETIRRFSSIWSSAIFPLSGAEKVFGAMAFGLSSEGDWPDVMVQRLRLVAQVFANVLIRKRAEEELQRALTEVERLKEQLDRENVYLREEVKNLHRHESIIGKSTGLREVLAKVDQVSNTDSTVLLTGETGTGKELIAQAIHAQSQRKNRIMVRINCASLPAALIENELFGREKGAYTGALTKQIGRFELADRSTIFLDEIGELPLELQAKLLRVLENGEFERLGSPQTIKVIVRVIAATNRNLEEAVSKKTFREDLYYRLNVFPIRIPPLRDRMEDIPILAKAFIDELSLKMGKRFDKISRESLEAMQRYPWPGNVRELRNVIEQGIISSSGATLNVTIPFARREELLSNQLTLQQAEYQHILGALEKSGWRIKGLRGAAELLGLKPSTLYTKMEKLGISVGQERRRGQA